MPEDIKSFLRGRAGLLGFQACGFAAAGPPVTGPFFQRWLAGGCHGGMSWLERTRDQRLHPELLLPGVKTIIMLAASYVNENGLRTAQSHHSACSPLLPRSAFGSGAEGADEPGQAMRRRITGRIARYACYNDYHLFLGDALAALSQDLKQRAPQETRWFVDSGPVLERDWAQQAGLGFVGKHTNLICRGEGNWVFLAALFTTLAIEPDAPERNRCGTCVRCLQACPTGAITAPFQLDARRCISYLTIEHKGSIPEEWRAAIGDRVFGCDDCLAACPWNRFARENKLLQAHVRPDLSEPDLLEWLSLDEAAFEARFRGTPLHRLKWPRFRRNICVVLGNAGDAAALGALEKVAADAEPIAAEHALWAMQRIQAQSKPALPEGAGKGG